MSAYLIGIGQKAIGTGQTQGHFGEKCGASGAQNSLQTRTY